MNAVLLLNRHKTWATLRLIEHCRNLDDDTLNATIPGTYGTIPNTVRHLVQADEDYFSVLTGEQPWEPLPESPIGPVSLDDLAERIRRLGPRWEILAEDIGLQGRTVTFPDGISLSLIHI